MGTATYPAPAAADKFEGYHYKAASNKQTVRQAAPRGVARQPTTGAPPPPPPLAPPTPLAHPAAPVLSANTTTQ